MPRLKLNELFFELSNENRLKILNLIGKKGMTLGEIWKEIGIPKPEIHRNLKRLVSSGIITKNEVNEYILSPIGKVLMLHIKNLNFLERYDSIFRRHDLSFLPYEFQLSLGELENIEVVEGTIEGFNLTVQRLNSAGSYENIMTREILLPFIDPVRSLVEKNLRVKVIAPYTVKGDLLKLLEAIKGRNLRVKLVERVDTVILVDEKTGEFNLPLLNGEMDYSVTFYGRSEVEVRWINRLFDHYWESLPGEIIF